MTEGISHWLGRAKDKTGAVGGAIAPGTSVTGLPTLSTDLFPAPTAVPITEAMLGDAMQKAYTNGASPTLWVVAPGPKRTVSDVRWTFHHSSSGGEDGSGFDRRCYRDRLRQG